MSISLTLDQKQKDIQAARDQLIADLEQFSDVIVKGSRCIISLIANVDKSSEVMAIVFEVMKNEGIHVEMMSQGASKVNISFIIRDDQIDDAILKLHSCLFEGECDVAIIEDGQIV